MPCSHISLSLALDLSLKENGNKAMAAVLLLCLTWAIWIKRNKVVFADDWFSCDILKFYFYRSLFFC